MSTTATATKLDRLSLENAAAHFPQPEIKVRKMVNYHTDNFTGVDIRICLQDGCAHPRLANPVFQGNAAEQKIIQINYDRDSAI